MEKHRDDNGDREALKRAAGVERKVLSFMRGDGDSRAGLISFQQEYNAALAAYLQGDSDEDALLLAYDLGRRGATHQLSFLDLSEMHQVAMLAANRDAMSYSRKEMADFIAKSTEFLCQVLSTHDMMYKGYVDSVAQLRSMNATLLHQANALRQSEERMRLFIKHNPAAVAMLDKDMRYMLYSPRWLSDYRLEERDITGVSHYDLFPEIPPDWREIHRRCLAGAVDKCDDGIFKRSDGSIDYVRWQIHPWYTDQQEIGGIIMFTEVITERKNQEIKIARLSRIREIMSAINAAIVRIRERNELMREVCRISVEHGKFHLVWAGFADPDSREVTPSACWARAGESGAPDPDVACFKERALLERVLDSGNAVVCNDIANDRRIVTKEAHLQRDYRSLVVFPIHILEKTVGVLCLYAGETGVFDQSEMKLLCEMAEDISFALDHMAKEEQINYLAYYDAMTDLPNRVLFFERLQRHIEAARREPRSLTVILLDFERFANINDSFGRHAGDSLIKEAANRLRQWVSALDTLAHLGGDRFALLLTRGASAADAAHVLEKLLDDCFRPGFQVNGNEVYLSVRAGISIYPGDGAEPDVVYKNAETALRKAKRSGETYLFYRPEMNASVAKRLSLENRLYRALERDEFVLYYQPKMHTATDRMVGMESLLRWKEPGAGLVPPASFITILEETGMILPVGEWIMEKAISDFKHWSSLGHAPPPIAVNISMIQLRQRSFVESLKAMRDKIPDGAHIIDLEITESIMMEDVEQNIPKLCAAREMGMEIAIDDFGTGYSSLSYLTRLPIDLLKIDRSFVLGMNKSASGLSIVNSIISLAHALQMKVIAEGVDDQEQAKLLRLLSCDELQGYLCSMPLPSEEIEAMLSA